MKVKMNEQTVFTTFPGSSTLEFQAIHCVPVYEPAERGWISFVFHMGTITTIDADGLVKRTCVRTGQVTRWYTRPTLQNVINMGSQDGIGGYYFEFHPGGSILSSSKFGTYYWGAIQEIENSYISKGITRDYATWEDLVDMYTQATDPEEIRTREEEDEWDRTMNRRWRDEEDYDINAEIAAMRMWQDALKARLATNPGVYENEQNRKAHEQCINTAEKDIARMEAETCSECRRPGVCMCYT